MHGPAELLPVSSSGHLTGLPTLLGWSYPAADDEWRKSFEVALHAGSALAWLLSPSSETRDALRAALGDRRQAVLLILAAAPAAAAGWALERPIERRLGRPHSVAVGLLLGSLAMVVADRRSGDRTIEEADAHDGLCLGLGQASALVPGISRGGATLSVARLRGFSRRAAWRLSARVATPVLAGATTLKLARIAAWDSDRADWAGLVAGAGASLASSLVSLRVLRPDSREWPLWPFAAYRSVLALALIGRCRARESTAHRSRSAWR